MITVEESKRNAARITARYAMGLVSNDSYAVFECVTGNPDHTYKAHLPSLITNLGLIDTEWCPDCSKKNHRLTRLVTREGELL
jgi:hypothetical protein